MLFQVHQIHMRDCSPICMQRTLYSKLFVMERGARIVVKYCPLTLRRYDGMPGGELTLTIATFLYLSAASTSNLLTFPHKLRSTLFISHLCVPAGHSIGSMSKLFPNIQSSCTIATRHSRMAMP